eukprot:snap_masked-scaffold_8-processed-gene-14.27-mRNA-1 protein AED:1.00 eAED:1.00 QI:0/0/0/0/1/1/2/0/402
MYLVLSKKSIRSVYLFFYKEGSKFDKCNLILLDEKNDVDVLYCTMKLLFSLLQNNFAVREYLFDKGIRNIIISYSVSEIKMLRQKSQALLKLMDDAPSNRDILELISTFSVAKLFQLLEQTVSAPSDKENVMDQSFLVEQYELSLCIVSSFFNRDRSKWVSETVVVSIHSVIDKLKSAFDQDSTLTERKIQLLSSLLWLLNYMLETSTNLRERYLQLEKSSLPFELLKLYIVHEGAETTERDIGKIEKLLNEQNLFTVEEMRKFCNGVFWCYFYGEAVSIAALSVIHTLLQRSEANSTEVLSREKLRTRILHVLKMGVFCFLCGFESNYEPALNRMTIIQEKSSSSKTHSYLKYREKALNIAKAKRENSYILKRLSKRISKNTSIIVASNIYDILNMQSKTQ